MTRWLHWRMLYALLVGLALCAAPAAAQSEEATQPDAPIDDASSTPPPAGLRIADWVVMFSPAGADDSAVMQVQFKSTLPRPMRSQRTTAGPTANVAQPIGVITFRSDDASLPDRLTVRIGDAACKFQATWPRTTHSISPAAWQHLSLSRRPAELPAGKATDWHAPLHSNDALTISMGGVHGRLLLYDVDITHKPMLRISVDEQHRIVVQPTSDKVLSHLTIVPTDEGWRIVNEAADDLAEKDEAAAPLSRTKMFEKLRPFVVASDLPAAEVDSVLTVLADVALWPNHPTVVARVGADTMNAWVPLRVDGGKVSHTRAGFIVAVVQPTREPARINALIQQLGEADWKTREAAEQQLAQLGSRAHKALTAASTSDDLEVRHRVERLLAQLGNQSVADYPPPDMATKASELMHPMLGK